MKKIKIKFTGEIIKKRQILNNCEEKHLKKIQSIESNRHSEYCLHVTSCTKANITKCSKE